MKILAPALALCLLSTLTSVKAQFTVVTNSNSRVPLTEIASYQCTFVNSWSSQRHPARFPSNPHWSPPLVASHNSDYEMWRTGGTATTGVENVAETGSTGVLVEELVAAGGNVREWQIGGALFTLSQNTRDLGVIRADAAHPLLSSISMIAPSPDWFSGFYNFRANNGETWFREIEIATFPWDAGTEQGEGYSFSNPATSPRGTIQRFTVDSAPSSGVFLNQNEDDVLSVASWRCSLQNADPETGPRQPASRPQQPTGRAMIKLNRKCYRRRQAIRVSFRIRNPTPFDWIGIFPLRSQRARNINNSLLWLRTCGSQSCAGRRRKSGTLRFRNNRSRGRAFWPLREGMYTARLFHRGRAISKTFRVGRGCSAQ